MRLAVVSDIHGNLSALEAVVADLGRMAPDLVLHGGDLADGGSSPAAVIDRVRELGWQGVLGNTDEMLVRPQALGEAIGGKPGLERCFEALAEMAEVSREVLGDERLAWLSRLPPQERRGDLVLLHGSPATPWAAPPPEADDDQLSTTYSPLQGQVVIHGHIHRPYVRRVGGMTVANSGSVGLPYDGDRRAAYLLVDDDGFTIRGVEYNVAAEVRRLRTGPMPHSAWVIRQLERAAFELP